MPLRSLPLTSAWRAGQGWAATRGLSAPCRGRPWGAGGARAARLLRPGVSASERGGGRGASVAAPRLLRQRRRPLLAPPSPAPLRLGLGLSAPGRLAAAPCRPPCRRRPPPPAPCRAPGPRPAARPPLGRLCPHPVPARPPHSRRHRQQWCSVTYLKKIALACWKNPRFLGLHHGDGEGSIDRPPAPYKSGRKSKYQTPVGALEFVSELGPFFASNSVCDLEQITTAPGDGAFSTLKCEGWASDPSGPFYFNHLMFLIFWRLTPHCLPSPLISNITWSTASFKCHPLPV